MPEPASIAIRTALKSIVVNASLAAVKIVTGVIGNSYALVADGIESINDIVSSGVVLISLKLARKPPDKDHPYGHGKAEQLGALFSAISLLAAGGTIAFQSTRNLFERHHSPAWFTLPVLLLVIVTKELLSRYTLKKSEETSSSSLRGDAWHHRSDAITSGAAFFGIVVALIGGPGYEKADDVAALVGCLVIGFNGISLLRSALHENMDGAPPPELQAAVLRVARAVPDVRFVEKLRMKKIGLGYSMDIHVQVERTMTVEAGHRVAHAVQDAIREALPQVSDVVTHLEPYPDQNCP
ncbi:cation diffusion facilitator family transporter [Opitutaceae bacterium TAV1]|nr:cation diffusion facilitator family transporter [Opitutaceae bacterium TAV1]